jgi:nitroreductase
VGIFRLSQSTVIATLKSRTSCAQLGDPPPTADQLQTLFEVAFRAADHRQLKPWRFLVVEGEGLSRLGELFLSARQHNFPAPTPEECARLLALPRRAPMIVVAISSIKEDPKVPEVEQLLSAGAAVQNMLNAAFAQGLGAIWRTGDLAFNRQVATGLGLADSERIVAFLYLGTPKVPPRAPPPADIKNHVSHWP